jgi:hypothetical protein
VATYEAQLAQRTTAAGSSAAKRVRFVKEAGMGRQSRQHDRPSRWLPGSAHTHRLRMALAESSVQMSDKPSSSDPASASKTMSSDAPSDGVARLTCDRSEPAETENVDGVSDPKDERLRSGGMER